MITATAMASTVSASPYSAPPCAIARQTIYAVASPSSGTVSWLRTSRITFNLCSFSSWSGLKHHGVWRTAKPAQSERKKRRNGMVIKASLFGVGAPEALVIGVVALLVFGPKGLAEVARNLGKTLRAFQPTIREIQDVSREFKSTLEREIGLDDIPDQSNYNANRTSSTSFPPTISSEQQPQTSVDPNGAPSSNQAVSSEDLLKITEEQLKAAATQQIQQQGEEAAATQQPQQQVEVAVSGETSTESPIDETRPKSETSS